MKGRKAEIHALNGGLDKAPPAPAWLPKLAKTKWARVSVCLMETVAGSDLAYHVTLLLLACTSEATFAADVDRGPILAQRWCASCLVVSSAQRVEIDHIPSFASIAQRADFSAEKLAFFLLEPHPKMPNMSLSRKEADDLAAYIGEQRRSSFLIRKKCS